MRNVAAAVLLLFSPSAMAATFVYTPVRVAPVVHVNPVVRANPGVHVPIAKPVGTVAPHSHKKPLPVVVYAVPQNQKCAGQKPASTECPKK
jgi:hypothetical protein